MVKIYPVEIGTKVIPMQQPYAVGHTTSTSKQFHASTGCEINKTSILYTIHRHKTHEQWVLPRSFILEFNSRIDSLYLRDWGKLFQSRHALNNTEFMLYEVHFAAGNLSKGPFLILYAMFLKTTYNHLNSGFRLFKDLKTSYIKARKWWTEISLLSWRSSS